MIGVIIIQVMPICLEMVIMKLALKERDLDKIKD